MALPKLQKAGIEQASPQDVANTPMDVKAEMQRLASSIQQASADGLKATAQSVIGNVPAMIKDITDELKSGPVDNFAIAINKLVKLTNELGIDLREYNKDLADTVDRFNDRQMKLEDKLAGFREQGLKAEIRGNQVVLLTQREIFALQQEYKANEKEITSKTLERVQLQKALDEADVKGADNRVIAQKDIEQNEKDISKLKEDNEKIEKKTGISADTGREDQGFSKFQEMKEAFMIIPDTIGEAMTSFSKAGKGVFTGLTSLFTKGGLAKAFKGLVNFFKTARIMIAGVFLLVVAAIQFVAERIDQIAAFFMKIWDKITGFFKAIGEWFSNSWLGKKLGLGKAEADEDEKVSNMKAKSYDQMDDGTYAIGNDGAGIKDNNVDEFLAQSKDASNAPAVDFDGQIYQPGEEGYEQAKANRTQDTQSYLSDEVNENAKALSIKDIIGDNAGGQMKTSSMLKSLESESNNIKPPTVINVQNNATSNSSQSSSSNVSGFIEHEPDTSFKFVKQGSTGSADF
jgi:hypothetical protein